MKKKLSIRELLHHAWTGLIDHFIHWLILFGTQMVVLASFLLCCSIMLALVHYFFIDMCIFACALQDYSKFFTVSTISIVSVFSMFFFTVFPIMYRQNALEIVFNRKLSGFDVNNRFFSYAVAMFFYWLIVALAACLFLFPGLFLAQRWRFVGLHLLDHGGNIRQAFRSSWQMTRGYIWFLIGISMIQWLLFLFCSATVVLFFLVMAFNRLIDAQMYKLLHMEYDKDLAICACEN